MRENRFAKGKTGNRRTYTKANTQTRHRDWISYLEARGAREVNHAILAREILWHDLVDKLIDVDATTTVRVVVIEQVVDIFR